MDKLEQQIAELSARLSATTAEKVRYKAERDALAEVVGRQHAELQLYQQQRHNQPHPNPVGLPSRRLRPAFAGDHGHMMPQDHWQTLQS